ncbi:CASP8 and FADD-like apoptosis regulator [Protopterus annectens]|uniref:CASP8 and FADD-like apoptosis regulator n=1 Tax=Protopterus annectens TaxID=7888 RepID=UPI001CFB68A9|nr:CASP8 and FADD-like apoptosis regulator [Protopterus annectens]XP_043931757.1 CASP8 and FADD-like apoptosis regulator [Protopterus annectens]
MTGLIPAATIHQIVEELSEEEKEMIVFMCIDEFPNAPFQSVKELLFSINRKQQWCYWLHELMFRLQRFDLLRRVLKSDKQFVETWQQRNNGLVSDYRVLMLEISEGLCKEDVKSFNFVLNDYVGGRLKENSKSFLGTVLELEKLNKVSPEQLDIVEKCLQKLRRMDLYKRILKYRQRSHCKQRRVSPVINVAPLICQTSMPVHVGPVNQGQAAAACGSREPSGAHTFGESVPLAVQESGRTQLQNSEEQYPMESRPVGLCLIMDCIGNDGEMVKELFEILHFKVLLHLYLSLEDMERTLRETALSVEHKGYNCFACFIISRGTPFSVLATDAAVAGITFEKIKKLFIGEACLGLLGKPKLFFIQNYVASESADACLETDGLKNEYVPLENAAGNTVASEADILWCYCKANVCILDQKPWQKSLYLCHLIETLQKCQTRNMYLMEILTEVNRKVYGLKSLDQQNCLSLQLQHTLRKTLMFPKR